MSPAPANWDEVAPVLDDGWILHLGVVGGDGLATSLPMLYVRDGNDLLLHGGVGNATLRSVLETGRASGTVTLVDALIVARSAFQSSLAYRSVVVTGAVTVVDDGEKAAALERVTEGLLAGRAREARPMTTGEIRATVVLRLTVEDAVLRVSSPVVEDVPSDHGGPQWAGVIPIDVVAGLPVTAHDVVPTTPVPPSVRSWRPPRG